MHLSELRIRNFRCIESSDLTPGDGLNLIVGDNASGKSSLLEAIFYLGRAQSFRRTAATRIIRHGCSSFSLNAQVSTPDRRPEKIGVIREQSRQRIKIGAQENASLFDLVSTLPLQIIDPNLHKLLEDGPDYRRRYLDWGVFHVEHGFYPAWRRYRRALRQRNGALRQSAPKTSVIAWDNELIQAALEVDACRRGYVDSLSSVMPDMVRGVLGESAVELAYHSGWSKDEDLGSAMARTLESDQKSGFTHVGPHRADLRVTVGDSSARDWVSRGQQKVITAVLLLAQATLLDRRRRLKPVLLLDDLAAELGNTYRSSLINAVERLGGQCFMTFLNEDLIPSGVTASKMFHVEHGRIESAG